MRKLPDPNSTCYICHNNPNSPFVLRTGLKMMQPFTVTLTDGAKATIYRKISGRKRSIRLILFKIKRRTQISYEVQVRAKETINYTVYKAKTTGIWDRRADNDGRYFSHHDKARTLEIKAAIDAFESKISSTAYQELF